MRICNFAECENTLATKRVSELLFFLLAPLVKAKEYCVSRRVASIVAWTRRLQCRALLEATRIRRVAAKGSWSRHAVI
jgi:hypothetical protein